MNILSVSVVNEGLTETLEVVNRFLKVRNGIVGPVEVFAPFKLDLDRSTTAGTNHTRIALKPSKRLLEFMAACGTSDGDLSVVKES